MPVNCGPSASFAEKIILHAYSGRRRQGNFQLFIDQCSFQRPGYVVQVVSVDIVIDNLYGDISRAEVREMWYGGLRQGFVVGFLCGPPCRTWSKARGKPIGTAHGRAPRVLLKVNNFWGLEALALREMAQITHVSDRAWCQSTLSLLRLSMCRALWNLIVAV